MNVDAEQVKLKRKSAPKKRTGCLTCKARKVKCDEGKPKCQRCVNARWVCQGYALPTLPAPKPKSKKLVPVILPKREDSSVARAIVPVVSNDNEERSYFYSFRQDAAVTLSGYVKSPFWTEIVLQIAHEEPSIMHGLAALGALTRAHPALASRRGRHDLDDVPPRQRTFALQQYGKAISSLRKTLSAGRNWRTALAACLLFVCIETLQDNMSSALGQMGWGISMLAQAQKDHSSLEPGIFLTFNNLAVQCYLLCNEMSVPQFVNLFTSLDASSLLPHHISLPVQTPPDLEPISTTSAPTTTPPVFHDVLTAKASLDILLLRTLQLRQEQKTRPEEERNSLHIWHQAQLDIWETAFRDMKARVDTTGKEEPLLILRVYYNIALILHVGGASDDEMAYDTVLPEFRTVVETSEKILRKRKQPRGFKFSFEMGLTPPLFLVASKCRDPCLRRKAISVCRTLGGQEGLWLPDGLADLGEWITGVEEDGWDRSSGEPIRRRVKLLNVTSDKAEGLVYISFLRTSGNLEEAPKIFKEAFPISVHMDSCMK